MPSPDHTEEMAAGRATEYDNIWSKPARDGFIVQVAWLESGEHVEGTVRDERGGEPQAFVLGLAKPDTPTVTLTLIHTSPGLAVSIDVTLTLVRSGDQISLMCRLPISNDKFFYDAIGQWHIGPTPPPPDPDPGPDDEEEIAIGAPGDAADLFPFIWQYALGHAERADQRLRFMTCEVAEARQYYANKDAAQKLSAAASYMKSSDYVSDLKQLPATIRQFPAARLHFEALSGTQSTADLILDAETELQVSSLVGLLQSADWTHTVLQVWESVFALALVSQPPTDLVLYATLLDVLRVGNYLSLLVAAPPPYVSPMESATSRHIALCAMAALPDNVALVPPAPSLSGADQATPPDTWEVLGVGTLKMARQHMTGYAPGELAEVVNVMPHTRQETLERSITATAERDDRIDEHRLERGTARGTSAASELADAVNEVMSAEGAALNMSGMTPSYSNLNLILNGAGSNSLARSGWSSADLSRMVQRLTEEATRRLSERISQQRGKEWQALREHRHSQCIDNANGDRLVGVFRWVDRVVRVHVEDLGPRLVLAFVIEQPAQDWIATVAAQGRFPLQPPVALPTLAASYSALTPANYQAIGAQYDVLALEPPPPAQLTVSATISRVTLGDLSLLRVPDGYAVQGCAVTIALSDNTYNMACSVGGVDLPLAAAPAPAPIPAPSPGSMPGQAEPGSLSAPLPACTGTSLGPAAITPVNQPTSVITTLAVTGLTVTTGCIPLTLISAAPLFSVTVTLTCALAVTATEPDNPLMTAWQMRIYDRLQQAWRKASRTYDDDLAARIDLASAGHTGDIQRGTLKQACIALLLQASGANGIDASEARFLEPLLDWAHMTWQCESPTSARGNVWPVVDTSEIVTPSSDRLFRRFLAAQSARVLLPVNRGRESALLFYLQFQRLWPGPFDTSPVTECTTHLLEVLSHPAAQTLDSGRDVSGVQPIPDVGARLVPDEWTMRVPTSMIYLQEGAELPRTRTDVRPIDGRSRSCP